MELEKLRARFEAKYVRGEPDECWEWAAGRNPAGYGHFHAPAVGERYAHRMSYRLYCGEIPDRHVILHACDNPPCVNPNHLSVGTYTDNNRDCSRKGRAAKRHPTQSKLSDAQVREIRRRYARGELQREIAADFDIYQASVSKIVRRERLTAVSDD